MEKEELVNHPIVPSPSSDIVPVSQAKIEQVYNEYYQRLTKMQEGDIIVKSGCKFCMHPARFQGEQKYEESGSYIAVVRFFEEYTKSHPETAAISSAGVSNHITQHYQQQQKKIWLREYSERVMAVINKKISDEHRLDMLAHQMEIKLNEIASDPNIEPVKQADTMTKIAKSIADIMLLQAKLRGDVQTVNLITEKFTTVWFKAIQAQDDPRVRTILIDALDNFQENLEGYTLDAATEFQE